MNNKRKILKKKNQKKMLNIKNMKIRGVAQAVECLLCKHEPKFKPSSTKNKTKMLDQTQLRK
jgi:predicted RNA-binding protein